MNVLRGTNSDETLRYNQRIVLEVVRRRGPLSRADIARATGLVSQTISNIADVLIDADLLIEERRPGLRRGQPPQDLRLNPKGRYSLGISIDRQWLVTVLTDFNGTPVGSYERVIANRKPRDVLLMVAQSVEHLVTRADIPREKLLGACLAMSGLSDNGSFVNLAHEYPWRLDWRARELAGELEALLGVPVFTDADRIAAAIGERVNGVGRDYSNYLYVFFGAGLGAGMIFSGLPYRGFNGKAGEIGHMIIEPGGRQCPCGNCGCLERYVSLQAAQSAVAKTPYAADAPDSELLSDALRDGHPALLSWLDEAAFYLRAALVSLDNILDCEAVLIGGLIPGDLLDALVARIPALLPSISAKSGAEPRKVLKAATGRSTVAVGAAAIPVLHATVADLHTLRRHGALATR